jgi:SPP1 gp7 family putative phage head morphogenesis protein
MLNVTPIPHAEATARIAAKPAVTRAVWDALHPDLQARAFIITGVECLDALARVRELTAGLPSGGDFDEIKSRILSEISPWIIDPNADEETRNKQRAAAKRRAEMLLRLHGWQAYAQTNYELAEANKDVFPFRQYLSSEDGRVRPSHAALNKKVLPASHPFWLNHTPPWEFNCRCDFVPLTRADAEAMGKADARKAPEDQRVMPPAQLGEIERNKRIVKPGGTGFLDLRTPREKNGTGYEYRPGTNALPLEQILERFSPAERTTFRDWAAKVPLAGGKTLADYWAATVTKPAIAAAATGARSLTTISSALQALTPEHRKAYDALEEMKKNAREIEKQIAAAKRSGDPEAIYKLKDIITAHNTKADAVNAELQQIIEKARALVELPPTERGSVGIISGTAKMLSEKNIIEGLALTQRYTHKSLLPQIEIKGYTGRAHYKNGKIYVGSETKASTVMHEITHGTEKQNPATFQASLAFLKARAGNDAPKSLRKLTGIKKYDASEMAWEDEWVKKGGNVYAGKDYSGTATEILTMGIERLHADPIRFATTDPKYFQFVLTTLQLITP